MEVLRRAIRDRLSYDSAIYATLSSVWNFAAIVRSEGFASARKLSQLSSAQPGPPLAMRFRNLLHPISLRPGTPDIATAINNFVREEYGHIAPARPPLRMIDAGGYIGDTSAYFLSKYPDLSIVAVEPDPDNIKMARENLAPYGSRVRLLNQALASKPGVVHISGAHDGAMLSQSGASVDATTVPELLDLMGWSQVDILKMDIEGAEADVLDATADAWLARVGLLIIELHGPEIERQVRETLGRNNFRMTQYRSLWYCAREPANV